MSNHSGFVPLLLMILLLVIWIGNLVIRGWQTTYTCIYLSLYVYKAKPSDDERCPYIETVSKSQVLHSCRSRAMEPLGHQTPGPWLVSPFFLFWSPCLSTSDPHKLLVSRERSSHVWWPNTDCAASKHSHIWPNFTSPDYLLRCLACSRHFRPLLLFCFWRQHMPLDWMLDSLLCFTIVLSVILMCNQSIHGCVQSFILVESLFVLSGSMVNFFLRFVRLG